MPKVMLTAAQAHAIKREISERYSRPSPGIGMKPGQYPPYALTPWEDRVRFQQYVEAVIDSFVTDEKEST